MMMWDSGSLGRVALQIGDSREWGEGQSIQDVALAQAQVLLVRTSLELPMLLALESADASTW